MKKLPLAVAMLLATGTPASAATIVLASGHAARSSDTRFTYRAVLGEEDSLHRGSTFIIYDFAGYVAGSIFASGADLVGSVEMVSARARSDGLLDDPALVNLLFTYVGAPIRNYGESFDLGEFGAATISDQTRLGAVRASTVRYDMNDGRNVRLDWQGQLLVPAPIPEPGVWATMIAGFGLAGGALRIRRRRLAAG